MIESTSLANYVVNRQLLADKADVDVLDDIDFEWSHPRHRCNFAFKTHVLTTFVWETKPESASLVEGIKETLWLPKVVVGPFDTGAFKTSNFGAIEAPTRTNPKSVDSELEKLLTDLGRLRDGWSGPNTRAPSTEVLRDVERVIAALEQGFDSPQIEIDADDGSVTLFWQKGAEAFSLILAGRGSVAGVLSPYRADYEPWSIPANETEKIARKLLHRSVQTLLRNG